ncbi:minor allergen Can f 2-like [Nycticebus coucang]|uniref:minor allergen Can f 2-like n=1 Tax=Nycticebus coucang TaxID=9470 RepID=UPI00234C6E9E|nr:minor allergen Can f 2-like [Nycticebus coucang]
MRLLLLATLLVPGLRAHGVQEPDLSQISGKWFTAALASNKSALIAPGGHFRVFLDTLDVKDGNVHGDILVPEDGGCKTLSLVAFKTDKNDRYQFSLQFQGHNKMDMVDVETGEALAIFLNNKYQDETSLVAALVVRTLPAKKDSLDAFERLCEDRGLHKEQIVLPDHTDHCQTSQS